jgi:hypothetical protein
MRYSDEVLRDQVIMPRMPNRAASCGKLLELMCARPEASRTRKRIAH